MTCSDVRVRLVAEALGPVRPARRNLSELGRQRRAQALWRGRAHACGRLKRSGRLSSGVSCQRFINICEVSRTPTCARRCRARRGPAPPRRRPAPARLQARRTLRPAAAASGAGWRARARCRTCCCAARARRSAAGATRAQTWRRCGWAPGAAGRGPGARASSHACVPAGAGVLPSSGLHAARTSEVQGSGWAGARLALGCVAWLRCMARYVWWAWGAGASRSCEDGARSHLTVTQPVCTSDGCPDCALPGEQGVAAPRAELC